MTDSKEKMSNWMAAVVGIGVLGAFLLTDFAGKERRRERKAFRELDLSSLTPKDIWTKALDLSRKRRAELTKENAELQALVDNGADLIEISDGLQKCAKMVIDQSVPEEVKDAILKHWTDKWWKYMRLPIQPMERLFNKMNTSLVDEFRSKLREYDEAQARGSADGRSEERAKMGEFRGTLYDSEKKATGMYCSFCGKSHAEVKKLIAGPSVYICNECIDLCLDIMEEEAKKGFPEGQAEADDLGSLRTRISQFEHFFNMLPDCNDYPYSCTRCGKGLHSHDVPDHDCLGAVKVMYQEALDATRS